MSFVLEHKMKHSKELNDSRERLRLNIEEEKRVYHMFKTFWGQTREHPSSHGGIPSARDHYAQSAKVGSE